MCETLRLYLEN